ncbi:hypothetical protein [Longimicrobium sp.]|uniref:hypothetical protein n=1 Tax=Longimicrobium sp. TaxID=2029185 RepID=UPI002C1FED7C|nr:hypothetical protein [Longimicrobium sp.]HSU17420.1 hypothetical protein [Longimicrobium sp.]
MPPTISAERADAASPTDAVAPGDADVPPPQRASRVHVLAEHRGWRAALREFAVIVAGVMCALVAQAWWQGREDRGRERDYLRQLLADTRENERRLDDAIRTDSIAAVVTGRAVDALTGPAGRLAAPDSMVAWVTGAGAASSYQPLDGNYRALVGTGDLRLVRNDSLRALLASYASSLESEGARQGQLRETITAQAGPMTLAFPFMRRVFLHDVSAAGVDVARLRADPRAVEVLFSLQAAASNRLSGLHGLRDQTRRLRRALEAEPAARGGR